MQERDRIEPASLNIWLRRLIISLTVLVWVILIGIFFWLLGRMAQALLLLALGALLAYTIYPLIKLLQRVLPRPLAVAAVYLLVLSIVAVLLYVMFDAFVDQATSLVQYIQAVLNGEKRNQLQPILDLLQRFGISQEQLRSVGQQLLNQLQGIIKNAIPVLTNVFSVFLNAILVVMLSVNFLLAGERTTDWLRTRTPRSQRERVNFLLDTLAKIVGGYIRGNILLATCISILTGIGIALIGVPYAFLLAVLSFILEFIPVIGISITGVAVVLLALTQSWLTGVLALAVVLLLQLIENNVLAPRIVGRAVGVNPIISLFALIAGTNLFGIAGAFFSPVVAGVVLSLVHVFWHHWRQRYPEEFKEHEE